MNIESDLKDLYDPDIHPDLIKLAIKFLADTGTIQIPYYDYIP
jgi:hypothetical protein